MPLDSKDLRQKVLLAKQIQVTILPTNGIAIFGKPCQRQMDDPGLFFRGFW